MPDAASIDWMAMLERFGLPTALVSFVCFCVYRIGQFLGPIIRNYYDRKMAADEKRADAAVMSSKAASDNAGTLAKTAEQSIEIQKDSLSLHRDQAESHNRLTTAFEALVARIDRIAFPPDRHGP
jgi:hypothetical protein